MQGEEVYPCRQHTKPEEPRVVGTLTTQVADCRRKLSGATLRQSRLQLRCMSCRPREEGCSHTFPGESEATTLDSDHHHQAHFDSGNGLFWIGSTVGSIARTRSAVQPRFFL